MSYIDAKNAINDNIYANGNQEVTGNILNGVLLAMLNYCRDIIGDEDDLDNYPDIITAINTISQAISGLEAPNLQQVSDKGNITSNRLFATQVFQNKTPEEFAQYADVASNVVFVDSFDDLPSTGESGKIYITEGKIYFWDGSDYEDLLNLSNYTQKDKEETIEKKWEFEKNIKIPKGTEQDEAVNLEQLDEKANLDDIKDGKFEVEGVGALEGSGTMTANQENDTNAELDLTQDTKDNIQKGIDAYDELNLKDYLEEIEHENTDTVELSGGGTSNDKLKSDVIIDPDSSNVIKKSSAGLFTENSKIQWDNSTKILTFYDNKDESTQIDLSQFATDIYVNGGNFDPVTAILTLELSEGQDPITIDLHKLAEVKTSDGSTIEFSGKGVEDDKLTAEVKISNESDNTIEKKSDGIYSKKQDLSEYAKQQWVEDKLLFEEGSGSNSIKSKNADSADGSNSVVIGNNAEGISSNSVIIGRETKDIGGGNSKIAIGYNATVENATSSALGFYASATGSNSFAIGRDSSAESSNSFAIGRESLAKNDFSTAIGYMSETSREDEVSIGYGSTYRFLAKVKDAEDDYDAVNKKQLDEIKLTKATELEAIEGDDNENYMTSKRTVEAIKNHKWIDYNPLEVYEDYRDGNN